MLVLKRCGLHLVLDLISQVAAFSGACLSVDLGKSVKVREGLESKSLKAP